MTPPDKIDLYRRQAKDINCRLRESEIFHPDSLIAHPLVFRPGN
jgi:hypothetical protein